MKKLLILLMILVIPLVHATDYYFSSSTGDDSDKCGISDPCATVAKAETLMGVNNVFYFKRGDIWRESFNISSDGVKVKAYGTGNKPKFLASINASVSSCWNNPTGNLWYYNCTLPNRAVMLWYDTNSGESQGCRIRTATSISSNYDCYWNTTYNSLVVYSSIGNPGTEWNGIEIPNINRTMTWAPSFWALKDADNAELDNLEFQYENAVGSTTDSQLMIWISNGVKITNCDFKYSYNKGIWVDGSYTETSFLFENNTFFRTGFKGGTKAFYAQGENLFISEMSGVVINNNVLNHTHNVGINFFQSRNSIVKNNLIVDFEYYNLSQGGHAIYLDTTNSTIIDNNTIINVSAGISINAEASGAYSYNNVISNNTCYKTDTCIRINQNNAQTNIINTLISHNSIYRNTYTTGLIYDVFLRYFNNLSFVNNVVYNTYSTTGGAFIYLNNYVTFSADYNAYNSTNNNVFNVNGSDKTFTQWKAYGFDSHGINANLYLNIGSLIPESYSPICTMSATSSYVGSTPCESTAYLYVNSSHASCNDSYTRTQANNPNTPWCGANNTMFNLLESGDILLFATGEYNNVNGYALTNKVFTSPVIITSAPGNSVNLSSYVSSFTWLNNSNASIYLYNASFDASIDKISAMTFVDNITIFSYKTFAQLITSTNPRGIYFDNSNNRLYLKWNTSVNPATLNFGASKNETLILQGINGSNLLIANLTFKGGNKGIYSASSNPIKNVTLHNLNMYGGFQTIDIRGASHITINSSHVWMHRDKGWWWNGLVKSSNMETSSIYMEDCYEGIRITNNEINGHFNGIYINSKSSGKFNKIVVDRNKIYDNMDDGIEIESYCYNGLYTLNNITDSYMGISMVPSNAAQGQCNITYNIINSTTRVLWDSSGTRYYGACFKYSYGASATVQNFLIDHNTCSGRGIYSAIPSYVTLRNMTWTNNVFYDGTSNRIIEQTGLAINNITFNYNLYYRTASSSDLFRYWNSDTVTTTYNLATALASAYWDGTWDTHSVQTNPLLSGWIPAENSPVCNISSTGNYIGAIPCTPPEIDNISPSLIIDEPSPMNEIIIDSSVVFNWTASDSELESVSFYLDGEINYTNSTPNNGTFMTYTINITSGNHTWSISACDVSNNCNVSDEYWFSYGFSCMDLRGIWCDTTGCYYGLNECTESTGYRGGTIEGNSTGHGGIVCNTTGCVDYVTCNDVTYTPLMDLSGNGYNLTNNGAVYNASGGWYEYDGINDRLVGPILYLNDTTDFSISVWLNSKICAKNSSYYLGVIGTYQRYGFDINYQCKIRSGFRNTTYTSDLISTINNITLNNWNNVIVTYNSTSKNYSIYLQGTLSTSKILTITNVNSSLSMTIGDNVLGGDRNYFNGSIGNIRFYNVSLNSSQITNDYLNVSPLVVAPGNVVAWYPFRNETVCE